MVNSYFSHDSNARNDSKVLNLRMKYGMEGYGIYFAILERMRDEAEYISPKDYNAIGFDLHVDASKVKEVVEDFGLFSFTDDGECFYSESFNRRMSLKDEATAKRKEAGKKGAAKRWGMAKPSDDNSNAIAMPSEKHSKESKVKRSKESKEDSPASTQADAHEVDALEKWQSVWGFPNAVAIQDLSDWVTEFGHDLVNWAIETAARRDVQSRAADKYVMRVMDRFREQGIKTVAEADAEAAQHEQLVKANAPRRRGARIEQTPAWLDDQPEPAPQPHTPVSQEQLADQLANLRKLQAEKSQEATQ